MNLSFAQSTVGLELGRAHTLAATLTTRKPTRVTCTAGTVWLTRERDPHDYVLKAGDEHLVDTSRPVVLLGMPRATVVLSRA